MKTTAKYLQDVLDRKNFARLMNTFGGSRIWVPKIGNLGHRNKNYYQSRNNEIRNMKKSGKAINILAEKYGLSRKRIYTILQAAKKARN